MKKYKFVNLRASPYRIALIYLVLSSAWIILSDKAVQHIFNFPGTYMDAQLIKGIIFVLISSILIFWLIRREYQIISRQNAIIKENEKIFRSVFEDRSIAKALSGMDGLLRANRTFAGMLGYTPDEFGLKKIGEIIHPADRQKCEDVQKALLSGAVKQAVLENRFTHKNGTVVWGAMTISLHHDEQGSPLYFIISVLDITEHKKLKESIKKTEEKYKLLIENQVDLMVKVGPDGRLLFVSPSYCHTFGKSEEELLGKNFMPLVHADDREKTTEIMQSLSQPPHTCYLEQKAKTVKGWRWFAWIDKAILDEKGRIKEIIGLGRDITDRKKAEEEVLRLKDNLQAEVLEKTKQLQARVNELELFHDATIDREIRMQELKDEIKRLRQNRKVE